jgi:4-hydroxybenzoate polyprenyltransferase
VLLLVGLSAGLAYNAGLKDTRCSWLPYVVAFAVLLPYVWRSLDVYDEGFVWLYAVGAPLALAAHVANALPDVEGDAAAGARGVVVALGRRRALLLLTGLLAAPVAVVALTLLWVAYQGVLLAATIALYAGLLAVAGYLYSREPFGEQARAAYRVVVVAAVVLAGGWLAAVA